MDVIKITGTPKHHIGRLSGSLGVLMLVTWQVHCCTFWRQVTACLVHKGHATIRLPFITPLHYSRSSHFIPSLTFNALCQCTAQPVVSKPCEVLFISFSSHPLSHLQYAWPAHCTTRGPRTMHLQRPPTAWKLVGWFVAPAQPAAVASAAAQFHSVL